MIMGQAVGTRPEFESVEVTILEDDAELLRTLAALLATDDPVSTGLRATITDLLSRQDGQVAETWLSALRRRPGQPVH
jgi:hypothetical protein